MLQESHLPAGLTENPNSFKHGESQFGVQTSSFQWLSENRYWGNFSLKFLSTLCVWISYTSFEFFVVCDLQPTILSQF